MKGYVYFARMSTGAIKIGFSTDVERRINGLWYVVPGGVELLASCNTTPDAEAYLHRCFGHLKISGEWFRPEDDLLMFVERVKAVGNAAVPEQFRAQGVEVTPRLGTDVEVNELAKFYLSKICEPIRVSDRTQDLIDRAAKITGLTRRRVSGIWYGEARAITAAEYLLIREIYEAKFTLERDDDAA